MNRFRWLVAALVVSLLVNLVLVGFMAGRFSAGQRPHFDPMMGIRAPTRFLAEERREELKPVIRQFREALPSLRHLRGTQRRTLRTPSPADPFEREPLEESARQFQEQSTRRQQAGHAAFVNLVEALTPEEDAPVCSRAMRARKRERRRDGPPPAPRP